MATSTPSVAELRRVAQPPAIFERNSGEHWAGRLYMRRLSPHVTLLLLRTPLTPNGVTWLMTAAGLLAAVVLALPGVAAALGAAALVQVQLLLDCCDGELARWRRSFSPVGVYLDRIGHYLTVAALPVGLGVRADGGPGSPGGWTTLGLLVAVLVLLVALETNLVHVARAHEGKPLIADTEGVAAPRPTLLRRARRALRYVPFFRAFVAVEASLLALLAAVADAVLGELAGSRALILALVAVGVVTATGHLLAILTSERLR